MAEPSAWAMIEKATNIMINNICWDGAEPFREYFPDHFFWDIPDDLWCDIGWIYDPELDTLVPPPPTETP